LESFRGINRLLICIDGINEIPTRHLQRAVADIQNLSTRMPEATFLITSRFERLFRALGFRNFEVLPFDNARISDFLHKTFASDEKATRLLQELKQRPQLLSLCRNPLLLYMLADISAERVRIPRNRGKLLHEFMNRFLDREAPQIAPVRPSTVRLLLSQLAFEMRKRTVVALPTVEVEQQVRDELRELQTDVGASDLLSAVRGAKLLHEIGDGRIAFFHELIQEYFAALELLKRFRSENLNIADYASSRWWQEVLILAYGLSDDDEQLFKALEDCNLALIAKGVMDGPAPDPKRQSDVVSRATAVLDQDATGQAEALEALATVWNDEALRRVARALDSSNEVIDFVERFADEPYRAVLDLIDVSPSTVVFSGAAAALRRTSSQGTPEQRRRLVEVCCEIVIEKADGSWPQLNYEQVISLSLLGEVGEAQRGLAQRTVHALVDIGHPKKAAKFAGKFQLTGTDPSLDYRLLRALIVAHIRPGNTNLPAEHVLDEDDLRTLLGLAMLEGQYRWLTRLLDEEAQHPWLGAIRSSIADHLLRSKGGRKAGGILKEVWGEQFAETHLRTRLARLEIEPENVSSVVSWLGARELFRKHFTDYVLLARRRRCSPRHFSRLGQWAEPGDLDVDIGADLAEYMLEEGHVGIALYMIYAAGISEEFSEAIRTVETSLKPGNSNPSRRHWQDLVCGKCWHWWSPRFQTTVLEYFLNGDVDPIAETWCQEARDTLAHILEDRFQDLDPAVRPGICRMAGVFDQAQRAIKKAIPGALKEDKTQRVFDTMMAWDFSAMDLALQADDQDRWRRMVLRHAEELAQDGRVQEAVGLLERWDIQPDQTDSDIFDVRSGSSPSKVVCAGYEEGVFNLPEVEGWFLHQLRSGKIGEALSVNRSRQLADELSGSAILAVLEMFEDERFKEAGQVIAGFDLQDEFGPELEDLIPHLISAGKPGIAHQLSENLGSEHTAAMGQLVVDTAIDQVEGGQLGSAIGLISDAGVSFIRREFEQRLVQLLINYRDAGKRAEVENVLGDRRIWRFVPEDEDFVVSLLESSDAAVPATVVRILENKGYGFASLPSSEITVFFHANEFQGDFTSVEEGSDLLVRVADDSRGPRATWSNFATILDKASSQGDEGVVHQDETDSGPDVEKLKEAWGARLRTDE
jgi:cold shock CspA family protein